MAEVEAAAGLVARFSKKSALIEGTALINAEYKGTLREIEATVLADPIFQQWAQR